MKLTEQKLRHLQQLTGLEEDEAGEILKESGGDELEALLQLERRGVIPSGELGFYSTAVQKGQPGVVLTPVRGRRASMRVSDMPLTWGEKVWLFLVGNRLVAWKKSDKRRRMECPLGALLGLLVIAWYVVVGGLVLGFLLGWRYRLEGPQLGADRLREVLVKLLRARRRR